MKIGFLGTHGTGKTVTMNRFLGDPRFRHYKGITSKARDAGREKLPLNKDATPLSQLLVTVSRSVADLSNSKHNIISDRTPVDSLAYTLYGMEQGYWTDYHRDFYWETSKGIVEEAMKMYDVLFFFPILWPVKSDGVRLDDLQFQEDIDHYMRRLVTDMRIEAHFMPYDTPERRVEFIVKAARL